LENGKRKRAAKSLVVARQRGRFCHVFVQNRAVFENLRARLDGLPVRALRGDSQKARFEDVFVLGDPVRGLSKSTHEPRESEREREPRVFLPEGGKLSVRARHFRELVTSESVSHAVV